MIVTDKTPFHEGTTVEEGGPMLPYADVITDHWYGERGIKIRAEDDIVHLDTDTLGPHHQSNGLTVSEARHLARLLNDAADKAAGYWGRS